MNMIMLLLFVIIMMMMMKIIMVIAIMVIIIQRTALMIECRFSWEDGRSCPCSPQPQLGCLRLGLSRKRLGRSPRTHAASGETSPAPQPRIQRWARACNQTVKRDRRSPRALACADGWGACRATCGPGSAEPGATPRVVGVCALYYYYYYY